MIISSQKSSSLPQSIQVGQDEIKLAESVRNLGVLFDSKLSMKDQVNKICQLAFFDSCTLGSIRHLLSVKVTQTLVTSLVLSRIDYYNSLMTGPPQCLLDKLQSSKLLGPPHIQVH